MATINAKVPELKCDSNGEIEIGQIISTINKIIVLLKQFEECCDHLKTALRVKTLREGNILYMTDDGTEPKNGTEK